MSGANHVAQVQRPDRLVRQLQPGAQHRRHRPEPRQGLLSAAGYHGVTATTMAAKMIYGKAAFLLKWNGKAAASSGSQRHLRPLEPRLDDRHRHPQRRHVRGRQRLAPRLQRRHRDRQPQQTNRLRHHLQPRRQLQHPRRPNRHQRHPPTRHRHDPQKADQEKAEEKATANRRSPSAAHDRRSRRQQLSNLRLQHRTPHPRRQRRRLHQTSGDAPGGDPPPHRQRYRRLFCSRTARSLRAGMTSGPVFVGGSAWRSFASRPG